MSASPPASGSGGELEEVVVTGFRASLEEATDAKRNAVAFTDSVFAEDIGKFPDNNLAESVNRIPGVTISRDILGEGNNVSIRGLGTNFTRVTLNNAPIAIASTGTQESGNTNREVDLSLFPTELFTQLTVSKSPTADLLEGGAAGTVNLRAARPFDKEGFNTHYSIQGIDNEDADGKGAKGSLVLSNTWGDTFGVLIGGTAIANKVRTRGFESVGWTNANLSGTQCSPSGSTTGCNSTGGGNWTIPGNVPTNAGNGLTAGAPIDNAFLLAHNPGLTIQQIDNAIIPRLGRNTDEFGDQHRYSGIVSLEYRPLDNLRFYLDGMYAKKTADEQRIDMDWVGRNGAAIPLNLQVDRTDCSAGCVATGGTFANSQFFLEYRPFKEDTKYWGANPGVEWHISDTLQVDLQGNYTKSDFHRESPSVLVATAPSSGVTVTYKNGEIPSIDSNLDLNAPGNFGWIGGRVNIQDEIRHTDTKGARFNVTWGDDHLNLKAGAAYDDVERTITALDNSQAWQNAICGDNPNVFVPGPNSEPPCEGLNSATPVSPQVPPQPYPTYPGLGTNFSTGMGPLAYGGSLIPTTALAGFLRPGPDGFITVDWGKLAGTSNYGAFHDSAPTTGASNTGANGGFIGEKVTGLYTSLNGDFDFLDHKLRYNAGVRWVRTKQDVGGRVSIADPRNAATPAPADGGKYPNIVNFVHTENTYDNYLPSLNLAYSLNDNAILRFALSKTMTRPDPNAMLPGLNFSSPSADIGTVGNSALGAFLSKNIDLGLEIYTNDKGYVSLAAFRKSLTGFTVNGNITVPFTDLAAYGVDFSTLTPGQQQAINSRGGPSVATVVLTQQVNAPGHLVVDGMEFGVVQSLDFLLGRFVKGFGLSANATIIDQSSDGAAVATGVSPRAWNLTAYYEQHGISARISGTFTAGSQVSGTNQNGIGAAALFSDNYKRWDFSSSFDLAEMFGWSSPFVPEVTFDVANLDNATQRLHFQFGDATYALFNPSRTYILGVRGKF